MLATADPAPRLFLALWPDDDTRRALAQWRDSWSWPLGAAPTRTERLHLTLHFIGSVAAERVDGLCAALARPCSEFTLEFGHAELWPHGIAVVCPHSTPAALLQLHADLGAALRQLSLPVDDRPLRAHVTLARRAQRATLPAAGPAFEWLMKEGFALVQSMRGDAGYRVLQRFR